MSVQWADVSEWQAGVDNRYRLPFFAFRSNDGTYRDKKFAHNLAWAKAAADSGRIAGFIVYCVYRPNWQQTVDTLKDMVGKPHPKMAVMIDMESWSGEIRGDQSAAANRMREALIAWLGGNRKRVLAYANMGDQRALWPRYGDAKFVIAAYGSNPDHPAKIAHQYSSSHATPPFGPCDINVADGMTPTEFADALGLIAHTPQGDEMQEKDVRDVLQAVLWGNDPGGDWLKQWPGLEMNLAGRLATLEDAIASLTTQIRQLKAKVK